MTTQIRFLRRWRQREPGSIDSAMGYGVQQILVQRGIAEFVQDDLETDPEPPREPKRRRSQSKEFDE